MALEDFSDTGVWTETDPSSHLTVTTNTITFAGLTRGENAWVVSDRGSGHFNAAFTHLLDHVITAVTSIGAVGIWMISTDVDDVVAADYGCRVFWYASGTNLRIQARGGSQDSSSALTNGTRYYHEIEYDPAVGTYGTFYCRIYSDSGRTTLIDTISSAPASATPSEQYVYGLAAYALSGGTSVSGDVSNLDLQEGGGSSGNPWNYYAQAA